MFHDASSETSLEHRCKNLYEKATKDPMTQVANRAEFDRVHEMFVDVHQQQADPLQPDDLRPGPIQAGQRHLRAPGRRRGHPGLAGAAEGLLPAGRSGGPLRRRGVRGPVRRLRQRHRRPPRRANPHNLAHMPQPKMDTGRSRPASASPKSSPATLPKPCSAAPTAHCYGQGQGPQLRRAVGLPARP